jgi:hypothetical protein
MKTTLIRVITAAGLLILSTAAHASVLQDCIRELWG